MSNYFKEKDVENLNKTKKMTVNMPYFITDFLIGIEGSTTILTRLNYIRDIKLFLEYLCSETMTFNNKIVNKLDVTDLNYIKSSHIDRFMNYLSMYTINGITLSNTPKTKARKLSSIRAMLKYFFSRDIISSNVASKITTPKIKDKEIVRLNESEVNDIINIAESGNHISECQKKFHKHTKYRDVSILALFLATGIRISELVGLNIEDVNLNNNSFVITRKGGNRSILYFSDEVKNYLDTYISKRETIEKSNPLFLSLQNKRLSVRSVENLVSKYSAVVSPLKKITPHKLRSTFGTNLYRQTKDIYVVADLLGHKDVNTTKKHYAAIDEDIKRKASSNIKLKK